MLVLYSVIIISSIWNKDQAQGCTLPRLGGKDFLILLLKKLNTSTTVQVKYSNVASYLLWSNRSDTVGTSSTWCMMSHAVSLGPLIEEVAIP